MTEREGMLNTRTGEYDFIGRSIPIFPKDDLDVLPGEKAYIKVKAPFCDKLSGMICTKFFGRDMVYMLGYNCKVAPFIKGAAPTCNCKLECPFIKGAAPTVKVLSCSIYKWSNLLHL